MKKQDSIKLLNINPFFKTSGLKRVDSGLLLFSALL
jgi:hypothetical protein